MLDYKTMYFQLAGKIADAIEILLKVQKECEEVFIDPAKETGNRLKQGKGFQGAMSLWGGVGAMAS